MFGPRRKCNYSFFSKRENPGSEKLLSKLSMWCSKSCLSRFGYTMSVKFSSLDPLMSLSLAEGFKVSPPPLLLPLENSFEVSPIYIFSFTGWMSPIPLTLTQVTWCTYLLMSLNVAFLTVKGLVLHHITLTHIKFIVKKKRKKPVLYISLSVFCNLFFNWNVSFV